MLEAKIPEQSAIAEMASALIEQGYRVWVSSSGRYGVYTDNAGDRVVYFEYDCVSGPSWAPRYVPNREGGTGFRFTDEFLPVDRFGAMLTCSAPGWACKNPTWIGIADYLRSTEFAGYKEFMPGDAEAQT